ncbi:MAG: hypothetical protein V3U24_03740 [Candidatus Neomarinimicrobiota bacterium]
MELDKFFQEVASVCGLMLLEYHASTETKSPKVKLVVDTEKGVTIGEIQEVTKRIRDWSGMEEHFPNGFHLEVTSPGLDYPLARMYQFKRNINRRLRVFHKNPHIPNPVEGVLKNVTEDKIDIQGPRGDHHLSLETVVEAKLVLK